ncbi:MAG: hypothetical protein LBR12_06340, partial [Opitutaceae bacterium]|nr:hypothetical protein [Opitutaceae bacterium]
MSAKTSAAASPLTRLARLAARLPTPANLYAGVTASDLPRPDNIVLFTRTSARQLRDGSHTRRQHHHHRHVLLVNLGASGTACIDQHLLPGRPGQALLIHPHQFHHFRDIAPAPLRWLFITFELPPPGHLEGWRGGWRTLDERALALLGELLAAWERPPTPQAGRHLAATHRLQLQRPYSAA